MVRTLRDARDGPDRKVLDDIAEHGWHVVSVAAGEGEPSFAFTIGLPTTFSHPELVIVGLSADVMVAVLNALGDEIRGGAQFASGAVSGEALEGYAVTFLEVHRARYLDWLGYACWYHEGTEFEALQVVWPDRAHRFPWQAEASDELKQIQRLLGVRLVMH